VMRTSYTSMIGWWCPLCSRPTCSLQQQSVGRHVIQPRHIILSPANQSLLLLINAA